MPAAHDTYTRELSGLGRGYPLYYPEPHPEDGSVKLGDVGYTNEGAFYRLFNVSLSADDPSQRFGVPYDFERLDMGVIRTFKAALQPGPLHSGTISTLEADVGTQGGILPANASFTFKCRSKRGAILLLESQMTREQAVQRRRFENYLRRHCHSWHAFAESHDIDIGFGDLMLVTECSNTAAWSSAVYSNSSREFSLTLSVGNPFLPSAVGASASSGIERAGAVELRASEKHPLPGGPPLPNDHTVFIKAYRLGTREAYLRSTVSLFVKARDSLFGEHVNDRRSRKGRSDASNDTTPSPQASSPLRVGRQMNDSDVMVIRPYASDYHPSIALLGLAMETSDSDCVIVHDDEWCSTGSDLDKFRIVERYADFYFDRDIGMQSSTTSDSEDEAAQLSADSKMFLNSMNVDLEQGINGEYANGMSSYQNNDTAQIVLLGTLTATGDRDAPLRKDNVFRDDDASAGHISATRSTGNISSSIPNNCHSSRPVPSPSTHNILQSIVKGRKSWRTMRGGEVVWSPELEAALLEGLGSYEPDDTRETRILGRFPMRNQFLSDWIFQKTGKRRTAKQVGSRLQHLRDIYGGETFINLLSRSQALRPSSNHDFSSPSDGSCGTCSSVDTWSSPPTPMDVPGNPYPAMYPRRNSTDTETYYKSTVPGTSTFSWEARESAIMCPKSDDDSTSSGSRSARGVMAVKQEDDDSPEVDAMVVDLGLMASL